jgi:hypothetical protein
VRRGAVAGFVHAALFLGGYAVLGLRSGAWLGRLDALTVVLLDVAAAAVLWHRRRAWAAAMLLGVLAGTLIVGWARAGRPPALIGLAFWGYFYWHALEGARELAAPERPAAPDAPAV